VTRNKKWSDDFLKLNTAAGLLLDDNLVWSDDLESIRKSLGVMMKQEALFQTPARGAMLDIADSLLEEEWDVSA